MVTRKPEMAKKPFTACSPSVKPVAGRQRLVLDLAAGDAEGVRDDHRERQQRAASG